ncbi:hypothetical protein KM043_002688 [Ampulex compressa]|nr:hypothetical protein KM043_002688 [Ampulex compressa]
MNRVLILRLSQRPALFATRPIHFRVAIQRYSGGPSGTTKSEWGEEGRRKREADSIAMPALQPVQRGLVFRCVRRSGGAFCRLLNPTAVRTMINKHGSPSAPAPVAIRSGISARSIAEIPPPSAIGLLSSQDETPSFLAPQFRLQRARD